MTSEPIAAVSAIADPDTPPNIRQRGDGDDAEPAGQETEQHPRELDDALADAALGQSSPAKMKSGTAIRMNGSTPPM